MSLICPASCKSATLDTRFLKLRCSFQLVTNMAHLMHAQRFMWIPILVKLPKDHSDEFNVCSRGRTRPPSRIRQLEHELLMLLDCFLTSIHLYALDSSGLPFHSTLMLCLSKVMDTILAMIPLDVASMAGITQRWQQLLALRSYQGIVQSLRESNVIKNMQNVSLG